MSFILDALRKSEIERQRQAGPSIAEFPVAREDRRLPIALVAIGALLVVNIAVVAFFVLREGPAPAGAGTQAADSAPSPTSRAPPATAPQPAAEGPSALEAEVLPPSGDEELLAEIYDAPATQPPGAPDPTLLPDTPVSSPGVVYSEAPPADDAASIGAATGLPELSVDLHIFTDDPAQRAVFINGRRYTQGDRITEGPVVAEITRDGAVLTYRGRRFLLPRL